jgi:prepilin-type N-terminal cleavage/methylation domain-containing protein
MRKQNGFSLIELLIVVAIILVIAAIAIPNFLQSRIAANEASAVASLRNIDTAQMTFSSAYPTVGFAASLSVLGPGSTAGNTNSSSTTALLLDGVLGCPAGIGTTPCAKSGYNFLISGDGLIPSVTYAATGDPTAMNQSGRRHFFTDSSFLVRYNSTVSATSADAPMQ